MKTVESTTHQVRAVVSYDADWEEWRVRLYVNGTLRRAATYHTDDETDAVETARRMVLDATAFASCRPATRQA